MPLNRLQNNVIATRNLINELQISNPSVYVEIADNDTPTIIQNTEIEVEAGMNLTAGWLVAIKDNLCYKATNLNADNLQPIGIVKSTVTTGNIATVILSGIINTSLTLTLYPDTPLYIRDDTINYNQTLLTSASVSEDLIQKIGYAITTNSFLLKIENYIQII
jgi:hypothetical protein